MKKLFIILTLLLFAVISNISAQTSINRYETEILMNPNSGKKDTREVNAVLIFEKDSLKIYSRRNNKLFKEIKYSDIELVEHSFSKGPFFTFTKTSVLMTLITGFPMPVSGKDKHWLTVGGKDDFAVLKIENDNYRLIKMEFFIRNLQIENVNENRL